MAGEWTPERVEKMLHTRAALGPRLPRSTPGAAAKRYAVAPERRPRATGAPTDALRGGNGPGVTPS